MRVAGCFLVGFSMATLLPAQAARSPIHLPPCHAEYPRAGYFVTRTCEYINSSIDAQGNFIVSDTDNNTLRKISPSGTVTTILNNPTGTGPAASGGYSSSGTPALSASANLPRRPSLDKAGNIYYASQSASAVQMISVDGQSHFGIPMIAGNVYTIAGRAPGSTSISGYSGDGGPSTQSLLWAPQGLDLDIAGNVYIADIDNCAIRMISADGLPHFGQSMKADYIYTIAGGVTGSSGSPDCGFSGNGGPATSARLNYPLGVAVDSHGDVYIGDSYNNMIRMVNERTGIITHVAGALTDANGNSLDGWDTSGAKLPPIYPPNDGFSGDGGPAHDAKISAPNSLNFDRFDNLYFSDRLNNVIRKIDTRTGIITTVIGQGGAFVTIGTGNTTATRTQTAITGLDGMGRMSSVFGFELFAGTTLLTALPAHPSAKCILSRTASAISDIPANWPQVHTPGDNQFYQITDDSTGASAARSWATSASCALGGGTMVDISMTSGGAASTSARMDSGTIIPQQYRILPDGTPTSVSWSGDGGLAILALINDPKLLSVDFDGNLFFYDGGAFRYRMVPAINGTYFGIHMLASHIYTIAGNGSLGYWSGDGGPATLAGF